MKNRGRLLRRTLGLLLAVALLLPLTGPGIVLEASAITKAEIDARVEQLRRDCLAGLEATEP